MFIFRERYVVGRRRCGPLEGLTVGFPFSNEIPFARTPFLPPDPTSETTILFASPSPKLTAPDTHFDVTFQNSSPTL